MTAVPPHPGADALAGFLGPGHRDVAEALTLWADDDGGTVTLPDDPWKAAGYTDALVFSVVVGGMRSYARAEGDWNLVAKIVPAADRREIKAHRAAVADAPPRFAARRLVQLRFGAVPVGGAKAVYFQDVAGGTNRQRPASTLSPTDDAEALVALCKAVSHSLATEWNTTVRTSGAPVPVAAFAHRELHHPLSGKGSVDRWATAFGLDDRSVPWVTTADGEEAMPNPVLLAMGHPRLPERKIQVLEGHGHGDLHLGNIFLLVDDRGADPESFRLIDLSTYSASAPRARDQLTLLLSAVARFWPSLSPDQREALLDDIPRAHRDGHPRQDPLLAGLVDAVFHSTLRAVAERNWSDAWHEQYVLALAATALRFTTFEDMGPELRWWFVRLACRAAKEHFTSRKVPVGDGPVLRLRNPFGATAARGTAATAPGTEPAAPAPEVSGQARDAAPPYTRLRLDGILPGRLGGPRPAADGRRVPEDGA
ncbi:hypothetical protein ACIO1C_14625 [Streptomyces sp. NPDC087420]|uniref:hypothetical protein n=1 Tax=Streptomyces sp. NPDC087420 TaxID=3365785 RepID=UPI0038325AE2